jgi:hypothetical protein
MKTFKTSLVVLFVASLAFAAEPAFVTKEATGQASVKDGEPKAYDEAVKQALRSAVEQASGVMITADTVTLNSQLVRDQVYARASGYVKKFDVVSKKVEKGVLTVVVKAEVGTAELDKDLEAVKGMITRLGRTNLLIVTQEQAIDDKGIATKSEVLSTALTNVFKKDGWLILDEKSGGADLKLAAGVAQGTPPIKEILKTADADYVVYGTINFRYHVLPFGGTETLANGEKKPIIFPVSAEYDLAMYNVRSREQLAKISGKFDQEQMQKKGIKPLISYSQTAMDFSKVESPRIIAELRNPVVEYLRNKAVNGNDVTVVVSGLPDFTSVGDFSESLKTIKDVTVVKQAGDFENGKMQYMVTIAGNASDLGRLLDRSKYKAKTLKVTAVKNGAVEVAIAK